MEFRKITAIINEDKLAEVEEVLQQLGVLGASVTKVKGHGGYRNFTGSAWLLSHVQLEVFIGQQRVEKIAEAILDITHSGGDGDGIIAISPVESIYRIRKKQKYEHDACDLD